MGRGGVYPVETSKVGSLLNYVIAYLAYLGYNTRPFIHYIIIYKLFWEN